MPKNLTIYIPDDVTEKMAEYPEVNWSEVCRKAITAYMHTRSLDDFGQLAEKLRSEGKEEFNKGQTFFLEVAKQMTLSDFEEWYPEINKEIIVKKITPTGDLFSVIEPYEDAAEFQAIKEIRNKLTYFCKSKEIETPKHMSDAFLKGAIRSFMRLYRRATPRT
ncbi:MAG TPA: hypothetical protein ENN36_04480 [Candidatus Bathyarchaeota archaeon]|nr:hypothetical protein [Candidatus Bathyarchaeota archaeon]